MTQQISNLPDKVLALASIVQTTELIHNLAQKGECDALGCDASISSIAKSGNNIKEIYNSEEDLAIGLRALKRVLVKSKNNKEILIYFIGLIKMEKTLMQEKEMLIDIATGIESIKESKYFEFTHSNSIAKLADIYTQTAGNLNPRIIINGKRDNLTNKNIINHIRALLLAGLRSVSLWRTLGGNIWYLLFNKKKIINMLSAIKI
jgi:high frequency lysogenization protein